MYLLLFVTSMLFASFEQSIIEFDNAFETINKKLVTRIPLTETTELIIEVGDITKKSVDAIVNAANKELQGGAGVCGAIFKTAGRQQLQRACNAIPADREGIRCPVGYACITDSFELSKQGIKKIIHAVGPDCRVVTHPYERARLLASAYNTSLEKAEAHNLTSIAFPFISSGIYACPLEMASRIPLQTIYDYVSNHPQTSLKKIYIVLFSQEDKDLFDKQWRILKLVGS